MTADLSNEGCSAIVCDSVISFWWHISTLVLFKNGITSMSMAVLLGCGVVSENIGEKYLLDWIQIKILSQLIFRMPNLWTLLYYLRHCHYTDVMMSAMSSQITGVYIVCTTVDSRAGQRKYQSTASMAFVTGIHQWPVNSSHQRPVTRKMFLFDDVIMCLWYEWHTLCAICPSSRFNGCYFRS